VIEENTIVLVLAVVLAWAIATYPSVAEVVGVVQTSPDGLVELATRI
jgi:hypothetical protein